MNKAQMKTIAKWILPAALLLLHIVYIRNLYLYDIKIALHWGCYLILFIYLLCLGEVKEVFTEFRHGIRTLHFLVKGLGVFTIAFITAMLIVYFFAKDLNTMYPLWQPFSTGGLILWVGAYIFLQPLVDNILYHKWILNGENGGANSSKVLIFVVIMLRTFVETGILIYSKDSQIPKEGFLALACWVSVCIFAISYILFKNVALTYTSEVMYRIALIMVLVIGMPQFYIPQF